jgi:hypothetical protein
MAGVRAGAWLETTGLETTGRVRMAREDDA